MLLIGKSLIFIAIVVCAHNLHLNHKLSKNVVVIPAQAKSQKGAVFPVNYCPRALCLLPFKLEFSVTSRNDGVIIKMSFFHWFFILLTILAHIGAALDCWCGSSFWQLRFYAKALTKKKNIFLNTYGPPYTTPFLYAHSNDGRFIIKRKNLVSSSFSYIYLLQALVFIASSRPRHPPPLKSLIILIT